jgi:hypothetical protein
MATIPASYEESRARFRDSLQTFQELWKEAHLISIPLTGQPDLTIEVITAEAEGARSKRLVLTTGLHGIEGFIGSGILQLFTGEFLQRMNPENTGILIVHPINPYGMKNRTRVNQNNVDLNRNFNSDFESLKSINPYFEKLKYLLNPGRRLKSPLYEKTVFILHIIQALFNGTRLIRETALMGQYRIQEGMYFGGFEQQEETRLMMDLLQQSVSDYAKVVAIDIHSGYGPRHQMTLVNSSSERRSSGEIASRYNLPRVVGTNPDEFYTMHGELTDYFVNILESESRMEAGYVGSFEFGTYGDSFLESAHSLRTTILENSLRMFGGSKAVRAWMENEYRELYLPSEPGWWEKAQADARVTLERILSVEGLI